jgi:hypothetical protein
VLDPQKTTFITSLSNATFPVLQLLDYVLGSNNFYIPRDASTARTSPYVSSYNGFIIPNFVTIGPDGGATAALPNSIDPGTNVVLEPNTLLSISPDGIHLESSLPEHVPPARLHNGARDGRARHV